MSDFFTASDLTQSQSRANEGYKSYNFYVPPEPYENECWSELSKQADFKKLLDARTAAGWRPTGLASVLSFLAYATAPAGKCPYSGCTKLPKGETCFACRCTNLCKGKAGKPSVSPDGSCHCVTDSQTLANLQKEISRRVEACRQEKLKSGTGKTPCDEHTVYVGGACVENFFGIPAVVAQLTNPPYVYAIVGGVLLILGLALGRVIK